MDPVGPGVRARVVDPGARARVADPVGSRG